jgi:hypothetical protein
MYREDINDLGFEANAAYAKANWDHAEARANEHFAWVRTLPKSEWAANLQTWGRWAMCKEMMMSLDMDMAAPAPLSRSLPGL